MQIILKQPDIEQALRGHIKAQGINLTGKDVSMSFTAGRKEAGISVELNITDTPTTEAPAAVVWDTVRIRPAVVKEVSLEELAPVAPASEEETPAPAVAEGKVSLFNS